MVHIWQTTFLINFLDRKNVCILIQIFFPNSPFDYRSSLVQVMAC